IPSGILFLAPTTIIRLSSNTRCPWTGNRQESELLMTRLMTNGEHNNSHPAVANTSSGRGAPSFAEDERGQISVLVILCVIPFIFLLAFIFNSARQTSRKMEMQGAADAAAVASAVTMARGMNFMVLNNNAMAETLSLMIAVRCIKNTARIMEI